MPLTNSSLLPEAIIANVRNDRNEVDLPEDLEIEKLEKQFCRDCERGAKSEVERRACEEEEEEDDDRVQLSSRDEAVSKLGMTLLLLEESVWTQQQHLSRSLSLWMSHCQVCWLFWDIFFVNIYSTLLWIYNSLTWALAVYQ